MPRLAWFSPLPPVRSGIARYCSDLLPGLAAEYDIDLFVDGPPATYETPHERVQLFDAHDFIWKNLASPYDLIVYQLGNAPCHDYMWAYLVRYPGLVVLHDGQLHHARGRMLLQRWQPRRDDYRREFRFNHPEANPEFAELGAVGLLGSLTYLWPMLRIVVESSRCVLVHNDWLAEQIREAHPGATVDVVEMGVAALAPRSEARQQIRSRYGIADDAIVFTAFGKVTPEKRVREALRALASVREFIPHAHLLVAGETVEYYDLQSEAEELGSSDRIDLQRLSERRGNRRRPGCVGRLPVHAVADVARDVGVVAAMPGGREADNLDRPRSYGRRSDTGSAQLVCVGRPVRRRSTDPRACETGRSLGEGGCGEPRAAGWREYRHSRRSSLVEARHLAVDDRRKASRDARIERPRTLVGTVPA